MPATKTKVFRSGNSNAVRIPKEIDLRVGEVYIERRGDEVVIRQKPLTLGEILRRIEPSPDFMKEGRRQGKQRERKWWYE